MGEIVLGREAHANWHPPGVEGPPKERPRNLALEGRGTEKKLDPSSQRAVEVAFPKEENAERHQQMEDLLLGDWKPGKTLEDAARLRSLMRGLPDDTVKHLFMEIAMRQEVYKDGLRAAYRNRTEPLFDAGTRERPAEVTVKVGGRNETGKIVDQNAASGQVMVAVNRTKGLEFIRTTEEELLGWNKAGLKMAA